MRHPWVVFLAIFIAACGGPAPSRLASVLPNQGEIVFGKDLDSTGGGVVEPLSCINPGQAFYYVARFIKPATGTADVIATNAVGSSEVVRTTTLVGGVESINQILVPFAIDRPGHLIWTVVLDGKLTLARGEVEMDSWPPSGC